MPRPPKTQAEIEAMRQQILNTAYAILQELGPVALTIREIARRLGVAHMSLYTYFENQAAILYALLQREMSKWRAQQEEVEQHVQIEDIFNIVEKQLKLYIDFARNNPNLYRLAWVLPEPGVESLEENRQRMHVTVEHLARLLKLGMEYGTFEPRDPFLAAATVLGMVNVPYILYYSGKMVDPVLRDRMVEEVFSAAMAYLKKR